MRKKQYTKYNNNTPFEEFIYQAAIFISVSIIILHTATLVLYWLLK